MIILSVLTKWFLARFRISQRAICEMSAGLPEDTDYHDFEDSTMPTPRHGVRHRCKRCGKFFRI